MRVNQWGSVPGLVAIGCLLVAACSGGEEPKPKKGGGAGAPAKMRVTLKVQGLDGPGAAEAVMDVLDEQAGLSGASVDAAAGSVSFELAAGASVDDVVDALKDAGFKAAASEHPAGGAEHPKQPEHPEHPR